MKRLSLRLQVKEFEGRTLLSASLSSPVLGAALTGTATAGGHHFHADHAHLGGTVYGLYSAEQSNPDTGMSYSLASLGMAGLFGPVTLSGSLHTSGFVASGHTTGTLTLINAQGSVTLQLTGTQDNGFGPLPSHFTFTVAQGTGTGDYVNFKASGTIDLELHPGILPGLASTSGRMATFAEHGSFTLTIHQEHESVRTGIRGIVREGPIWPVVRPGVPNARPLPGAILSVWTADGKMEVARQKADANGEFRISLDPGKYLVIALPPDPSQPLPRGTPQKVVVTAGHVLDLTFLLDTGIR